MGKIFSKWKAWLVSSQRHHVCDSNFTCLPLHDAENIVFDESQYKPFTSRRLETWLQCLKVSGAEKRDLLQKLEKELEERNSVKTSCLRFENLSNEQCKALTGFTVRIFLAVQA